MISLLWKHILKFEIEIKRKIMYKKAKDLGFTHPQVVHYSQELDELLNKYSAQTSKIATKSDGLNRETSINHLLKYFFFILNTRIGIHFLVNWSGAM